jgi:hypothetical protein
MTSGERHLTSLSNSWTAHSYKNGLMKCNTVTSVDIYLNIFKIVIDDGL